MDRRLKQEGRADAVLLHYRGERATLSTLVSQHGVASYDTTRKRLRMGWGLERALHTPTRIYEAS